MANKSHRTTRRNVLKLTGAALATTVAATPTIAREEFRTMTDSATDICSCSATLHGTADVVSDSMQEFNVGFEWGVKGTGLPNSTNWQSVFQDGPYSDQITGLECATTYEYRAVGLSLEYGSPEGDIKEFTTPAV